MHPLPILSHSELLKLAEHVLDAAHDHDAAQLEADALHLFDASTEHMLAEQRAFQRIRAGDARLVARGQRRLRDLIIEIASCADQDLSDCRCESMAQRLVEELTTQSGDEHRYLIAIID